MHTYAYLVVGVQDLCVYKYVTTDSTMIKIKQYSATHPNKEVVLQKQTKNRMRMNKNLSLWNTDNKNLRLWKTHNNLLKKRIDNFENKATKPQAKEIVSNRTRQ